MLRTPSETVKGTLALLTVYLVWGTTFGAIRIGVETIPSAALVCARFTIAGGLLLLFCLLQGEKFPQGAALRRQCIVGTLLFFAGNSLVSWTLKAIPTGLAGILVATNAFWMPGLAALFPPKEPIRPMTGLGLLIGFIGMLVLLSPSLNQPMRVFHAFWNNVLLTLLMVFCWSAGSVYARKVPSKDSLLMGVAIQNLFAGLLLLPLALWSHSTSTWHPSWQSLTALGYLIVVGTIIAAPCYLYTLKVLPVSVSSTFAYVTPILTLLFGCIIFRETVTPVIGVGTLIILAGVGLVQWASNPDTEKQQAPEFERLLKLAKDQLFS